MALATEKHTTDSYRVTTPLYEGPLDLLLQLIERAELDITSLALAQVTDQYIEHLHHLQVREVNDVSEFLVIAAKLLQIKSEALLPKPPTLDVSEEEPGAALARQLRVYKRYKEIALLIGEREGAGLRTFLRLASTPDVKRRVDIGDYSLADIIAAAREILSRMDDRQEINSVVIAPTISIREKITQIAHHMQKTRKGTFTALFTKRPTNVEIVITFLAMLELIKRHLITVQQSSLFGDIVIEASEDWDVNEEFELEFGD